MALVYLNLVKCKASQLLHRLIVEQPELCHGLEIQTQDFPEFLVGWPLIVDIASSTRYYGDDAFEYILRRQNLAQDTNNTESSPAYDDHENIANDSASGVPIDESSRPELDLQSSKHVEAGAIAKKSSPGTLESSSANKAALDTPNLQHVDVASSAAQGMDPIIGTQDQFSSILKTYKVPK